MSDFINKVIEIKTKEEKKTKAGTNTKIHLADQDGVKYSFFRKKKDGSMSSPAQQFKDMDLDEGSVVQISWVIDTYEVEGKQITENKVTGFRETSEQPTDGQNSPVTPKSAPRPEQTYQTDKSTDWDEIAVGKCQSLFIAAYLQSGKTFADAKLQVVQARQLAELVVYGTQKSESDTIGEVPQTGDDIPLPDFN